MASNSSAQGIVPASRSQSTSARLRSLFSSRCNCFNCSSVRSNAMPSASSTTIILIIPAAQGIAPSPSHTHASEHAAPSTSTFTCTFETENEHTNASEQAAPSTSTFCWNTGREAENKLSNAFEQIAPSASTCGRSTMPERKLPYDVFINHRGPDVKHTLAATLYKTLTAMGLRVFLDKEELELGDCLPAEIEEAMRSASLHIAIFSQNYAESPWCLAELAFMLKTGTPIVPIFYHVETDGVRYAKGVYAEAFSRHEEKGRYTLEKLQEWKNALKNVSYNFGDIVRNEDDEMRLLKNIVNRVLKEIKNVPFEVAKHPVGLDEVVKDFKRTVLQSAESHHTVQIVGIWGMGGSGKTTLAKQIYNNKYSIMDKSSFLLDVRDAASKSKLHKKQNKLLQDLGLRVIIENIEEGKGILSSRLQSIRVLIILDDVDNVDQLDALVPKRDSLGWGSLIVVTSRELQVLRSWGISSIYKMKALDPTHAKQLFCWHAFLQPFPRQGFEDLVESFLNVCDGLPLSLKVFGAQLYGISNKNYWSIQFHKISRILPKDIKDRLKVSYDALEDEEKQVFLDISCFFIGEKKTSAIAAWDGSGWNGLHCWEQLLNKCLVEFNDDDYIRMHDHLRDLGREIAIHQSPYRLWSPQQVINVDNEIQGVSVRGIMAVASDFTSKDEEFPKLSKGGKLIVNTNRGPYSLEPCSLGLKIFHVNGNCSNQVIRKLSRELVWLRWNSGQQSNLSSLGSLKNLRVLKLYGGQYYGKDCLKKLWKTDNNGPAQLRELVIEGSGEFQRFPKSIGHLEHLKKIVMSTSCKLRSLSEEFCLLQSLEHLELHGGELSSLPNSFGDLRNLRHIDLPYCGKLTRLPVSFKELTLLQHLNLKHCSNLTLESDILENMMKLEYLNIQGCDLLEELPRHMTNQPSLTELSCGIKKLREIPKSIGQLRKLQRISIGGELLTSLPTSMGDLSSLTSLTISDCGELKCLPDSLGCLHLLNVLTIYNCPKMKCLPDSLGCLDLLNLLKIYNCPKMKCLPDSLGFLNLLTSLEIDFVGIKSLPKSIRQLVNLQTLEIRGCPINELDIGTGLFTCLKRIVLDSTEVSKISMSKDSCPVLRSLSFCNNKYLTLVEVLPDSLEHIFLKGNPKLEALPSFAQSAFLRVFKLLGCYRVKKIHGLEHCTALEELKAETRWEEAGIESLERMERLREVQLKAFSRSGVEGCIQSMKKWPREDTIVYTQAVPDGATLANFFASPSNLSVVDSFYKRKIESAPSLKWPSTTRGCILLCYIINCESPETTLQLARSTGNVQEKAYVANYDGMKLEKGKWVWTGLFTQHSIIHSCISPDYISPRTQSRVHICVCEKFNEGEVKRGEVNGVLVTGEEERVKQAFIHLWASLLI